MVKAENQYGIAKSEALARMLFDHGSKQTFKNRGEDERLDL